MGAVVHFSRTMSRKNSNLHQVRNEKDVVQPEIVSMASKPLVYIAGLKSQLHCSSRSAWATQDDGVAVWVSVYSG